MKFRIKIRHFSEDKYTVQYAYYRFIPIWSCIPYWFESGYVGNLEGIFEKLYNITEAEKVASMINSMEDVNEIIGKVFLERDDFYKRKRAFLKDHIPYHTKEIVK